MRAVAVAGLIAGALAVAPAGAVASAGDVDRGYGSGGLAATPFGPAARAAAVALTPDGRLALAGDVRDAGGESFLTARLDASGAPDPSFASVGGRLDRFGSGSPQQRGRAVLVAADGGVLVAGAAGDQLALAHFAPDGLADGLFGAGGVALRDPSAGAGLPEGGGPAAMAVAPNGQIVVAGSVGVATDDGRPGEQIVVARYSDRGLPDPGFGSDGFAVFQLGARSPRALAASAAHALAVLADGRVVVAGVATDGAGAQRAFVARLTAAGRLDTTFARGGRLLVQLGRRSAARAAGSSLDALAMRSDGTLLAAGRATDAAGADAVALASFTATGAPDAGFGRGGVVVSQLGSSSSAARALALGADGSAYVAGAATGGALAARYSARNGRLDCSFGRAGRAVVFGGAGFDAATDGAAAALLQPGAGLLLAGRRAGGGVLLGRLATAPGVAAVAAAPSLVTLAPRYVGKGRGYAYGLVDGRCRSVVVRFEVAGPGGRVLRTTVQRVLASGGPQVVCAPLRGLRPGERYRVRVAVSAGSGAHGARRALRAGGAAAHALAQDGCR